MDESPFADESFSGDGKVKLNLSSNNDVESTMPTVRSVSSDIVVPPTEEFQIRMTSSDGSYNKLWTSLKEFEKEEGFAAGSYTIEAFYGTPESQGVVKAEEKGHEHSYFYGKSESVSIENGKETNVSVTAKLANAVVIIEYSDAFKHYFTDWTTDLITTGSSSLNIGNQEGMCYVVPGDVEVVITAAQQNGKALKLNPATFEAEAQHLYKIKYDIYNGEIGQVDKLVLTFNDDMDDTHNISIDLTEELFNGKAPVITSDGFELGTTMELSDREDKSLKFVVSASGGIESAILSIKSTEVFNPDYLIDGSLDLCTLDETQKAVFEEKSGIKILGFMGNTERMAQVDLSGFYKNLVRGEHTVSLLVKDKYMRSSDNATLTISRPVEINVEAGQDPIMFGENEGEIIIYYNGPDPTESGKNPFTFKAANDAAYVDAEIISINNNPYTRAIDTKEYVYKIKVPYRMEDEIPVKVYYNNATQEIADADLPIEYPDYDVEYDPMATALKLKVDPTKNDLEEYNKRLRIFINNQEIAKEKISFNDGVFTVKGINEEGDYIVKTTICHATEPTCYFAEEKLTPEVLEQVPNGSFNDVDNYMNETINHGGKYSLTGLVSRYDTETYNINVPQSWTNVNIKTCNTTYTTNKNTWFMAPSVLISAGKDGNGVSVRNVGFSYQGTDPDPVTGKTGYNPNPPSVQGLNSAGKLYLGSYDIEIVNYSISKEEYNQGYSYNSRPSKFSGWYKYTPCENSDDKATVEIYLEKDGETIVGDKIELGETQDWAQFTIEFDPAKYGFKEHPDNLKIMFCSSKYASNSWEEENTNVPTKAITDKELKYLGSELIIDDLKFE